MRDGQRRATILLVEDNEFVRSVTEQILRHAGFTVLASQNGNDALSMSRGHDGDIDLLFTDVIMPGMTGPELGRQLRRERPKIKVLLTSGYAELESGTEQAIPNIEFYLAKPFSVVSLIDKVSEVLSFTTSVSASAAGA